LKFVGQFCIAMKNLIFVITILFFQNGTVFGQAENLSQWKFVSGREGIKVYNRSVLNSKIKALKAECILKASAEEVVGLLLDIPAAKKWVCHAKECVLLKTVSDRELFYYTEVDLPWPLDNRDFVTHLKISEDPVTKAININAPAVPGIVPPKKGRIRISQSMASWTITPVGGGKLRVEYTLQVDPGGLIPAHIVNMFACQAPVETFTNMKKELQLRRAKSADSR
jgi:hypothetical protein